MRTEQEVQCERLFARATTAVSTPATYGFSRNTGSIATELPRPACSLNLIATERLGRSCDMLLYLAAAQAGVARGSRSMQSAVQVFRRKNCVDAEKSVPDPTPDRALRDDFRGRSRRDEHP